MEFFGRNVDTVSLESSGLSEYLTACRSKVLRGSVTARLRHLRSTSETAGLCGTSPCAKLEK